MKQLLLTIAILSATLSVMGQAIQPCIVKQYNRKMPKTPLSGVEVIVSNAGSQISASDGKLVLNFRTLKPGDKVNLISAQKSGFEVMNTEAVEQWFISRDQTAFEMVMVNSEDFARLKKNLTEASTESYRTKYRQAMLELEQQKKAGRLKEEEFSRKCDTLETSYKNQLKNLGNYIDQFARIDLCKVSVEEQHILEMVEQGKIDDAVKAYEELDITSKLRQARENKKNLSEAKARIEEEETRQDQAIKELKAKQEREIATLKLAGGKDNYDKIARLLKENALADSTDIIAIRNYANFSLLQKDFKEAEDFYLMALKTEIELFSQKPDAYRAELSKEYNNLGTLYINLLDYKKAEYYLLKSLEEKAKLFDQNPDAFRNDLAIGQHNLGRLYSNLNDYTKAEDYYLQSIKNKKLLLNQNSDEYRAELAATQNNLGVTYYNSHQYSKAEPIFLEALENRIQLFNTNPNEYQNDLAISQNNLGLLYSNLHDYPKAEYFHLSALENRTHLFKQNPEAYRPDLAITQSSLGILYYLLHDYTKAEEYYLKALENLDYLFNQNPDAYRVLISNVQTNLGALYNDLNDYAKSEDFLLKALEKRIYLFNINPNAHRARLTETLTNLGVLYITLHDYTKAEEYYLKALENLDYLFNQNPDAYRINIAIIQYNLGSLYHDLHNYAKAEENYLKAIDNYTQLFHLYPDVYRSNLCSSLNSLTYLFAEKKEFDKAIETIDRVIALTPDDANSYDTKGEILLLKGDEQGALEMWQKVMELDSDFLSKYNESTELYKQLQERGLLK